MDEKKKLIIEIFAQALMLLDMLEDEKYRNLTKEKLEEMCLFLARPKLKPILRLQNFAEKIIQNYNNQQFKDHFRMSRSIFYYVLNIIKSSVTRSGKTGHKTISPEKQFLIAIWKMATPDSYRSICAKFNVGKATALKAVRSVTKAIVSLSLLFIRWLEGERAEEVIKGFTACSAFPNVIGAIDGAHINIRAPYNNPECYINRKRHHSIHLQAICDNELQFTHCLAGHVGSIHDQRVFQITVI
uniref:putative nuclease HARBI1 n=1 Tax=Osmia lignaria TaxID=473952 RepID=UPI0014783F0F|nr:putative nuclease HARBI1 [Osmia lignaria]